MLLSRSTIDFLTYDLQLASHVCITAPSNHTEECVLHGMHLLQAEEKCAAHWPTLARYLIGNVAFCSFLKWVCMIQQDANYLRSCIIYTREYLQLMLWRTWRGLIAMLTWTF